MKIQVSMFPAFVLSDGATAVTEEKIRSEKLLRLLAYLVFHHERVCSAAELAGALWPGDKSVNPAGALKNLAYRLRTFLKQYWPDTEFILTGRGSYGWNPDVPTVTEADTFSAEAAASDGAERTEEIIEHAVRAAGIYRGTFLKSLIKDEWVIRAAAGYKTQYLDLTRRAAELLLKTERPAEAERITRSAISTEPYDEGLRILLMRALIAENRQEEAEEEYRETAGMLYDSLGISPSDEMKNLFGAVMEREHRQETDLAAIQRELREAEHPSGAYECGYGVFKKIYELEARRVARMGMAIYLSLITIYAAGSSGTEKAGRAKGKNDESERAGISRGMREMHGVIRDSLRSGDVFARYSANQYLIMLPACPYENARMVMERILRNFDRLPKRPRVHIQYTLREMEQNSEGSHGNPVNIPSSLRILVDRADPAGHGFTGRICGVALKGDYPFEGAQEFMCLVEELLNRIGKPQPGRLPRNFTREKKYVSFNASPEIFRSASQILREHGKTATFDCEFRSRACNTWQGMLYDADGSRARAFSSELELIAILTERKEADRYGTS